MFNATLTLCNAIFVDDKVTQRDGINTIYSGFVEKLGLTLGYFLAASIIIPLGMLNLTSSIRFQIVSYLMTTVTLFIFFIHFCVVIMEDRPVVAHNSVTAFEEGDHSLAILGFAVSYMYVATMPAWLNERTRSVPINAVVWTISGYTMVAYLVLGLICATAFPLLKWRNVMQVSPLRHFNDV